MSQMPELPKQPVTSPPPLWGELPIGPYLVGFHQHSPNFAKAYEALGDLYHYTLNDKSKARVAYEAALEALPRDSTLLGSEQDYLRYSLSEDIEALT